MMLLLCERCDMRQDDSGIGDLSEDELRLIAFYRSQNPRVREILMNMTYFETGLANPEPAAGAVAPQSAGKSKDCQQKKSGYP